MNKQIIWYIVMSIGLAIAILGGGLAQYHCMGHPYEILMLKYTKWYDSALFVFGGLMYFIGQRKI